MLVMEILDDCRPHRHRRGERRARTRAARAPRVRPRRQRRDHARPLGLELLESVRPDPASLPVVLVTGAGTYDTLSQALTRGAAGLVTKPFAHAELQAAVADALDRASRDARRSYASGCSPRRSRARSRTRSRRATPTCTGTASDSPRSPCASQSCWGSPGGDRDVRLGAILHDVGKIGIPDRVLLKPARSTTRSGASSRRTRRSATSCSSRSTCSPPRARSCATTTSAGTASATRTASPESDIPLGARIVAVADSVEVMSSRQLYRQPRTPDAGRRRAESGSAARSGTRRSSTSRSG